MLVSNCHYRGRCELRYGGKAKSQSARSRSRIPRIAAQSGAVVGGARRNPADGTAVSSVVRSAVERLFNFPPVYAAAVKQARSKITQRGAKLGVDFDAQIANLRVAADWDKELQEAQDPALHLPDYYKSSFHAYEEGNLCWQAALEANMVSQFVHATVMDPQRKHMDPEGDAKLRSSYSTKLKELMQGANASTDIRLAVDLGCSTGLSTLELSRAFPAAQITGLDLSPYFITVAQHDQRQRQADSEGQKEAISFRHAAAEGTDLPSSSQDLVSACLLFHELPASAACQVMTEAFRILRPGGVFAIMEMNPKTASFSKVLNNPIAYAAFKSTEPWLLEYIMLDLPELAQSVGFERVAEAGSSPSHKTFIACKPS